jgi:hypothetical protein
MHPTKPQSTLHERRVFFSVKYGSIRDLMSINQSKDVKRINVFLAIKRLFLTAAVEGFLLPEDWNQSSVCTVQSWIRRCCNNGGNVLNCHMGASVHRIINMPVICYREHPNATYNRLYVCSTMVTHCVVLVYCVFNDTVSSSEFIAPTGGIISE